MADRPVPAGALLSRISGQPARERAVDAEVALAVDRERRLLAQDLHDGLGQWLAIVKIKVCSLRNHERRGRVRGALQDIEALVDRSNQAVRSLMLQLSPPALQALGLVPAIEWLAEEIGRECGLKVGVVRHGQPIVVAEPARTTIFQVIRELLIGWSTQAGSEAAHILCQADQGGIMITVSGDGAAYEPSNEGPHGEGGFGLVGLMDRIHHVGGEMRINTAPGCGMSVAILYPARGREEGPQV